MAYNLPSLAYSINQALHPVPQLSSVDDLEKEKLESLLEKVTTLQQILEKLPLRTYNRLETLQREVIDLSHRAEDIVDSANVDRTLIALSTEGKSSTSSTPKSFRRDLKKVTKRFFSAIVNQVSVRHRGGESSLSSIPDSSEKEKVGETFLQDLQKLIEEFDSLIKKVPKIVDSSQQTLTKKSEDLTIVNPNPESSSSVAGVHARMASSVSSLKRRFTSKGFAGSQKLLGLEEDMENLKHRLTRNKRDLEVIPIVGMGGIGKTTLARELYHYARNTSHFDCVAWAEISQVYDVNKILTTLMSCLTGKDASDFTHMGTIGRQDALHQTLCRRRYLIVLDDIWDTNVWDNLRMLFPEDRSKSTIILTTRDLEVAKYATKNARSSSLHTMRLLGDDDSWHLFHGKVFAEKEDHLDPELERLGRDIVKNCKGLPLAISVISGLLVECDNTEGKWEQLANDICTVAALEDDHFTKILSLSYDHLPHHLRPCLLYLGEFSKGAEIRVSRIKRLWAAESFLKPIEDKTPEEAAEQYLEDLENRNLVVVSERKSCGKVKSYGMHDLLNDLCIRRAEQEDFVVRSGPVMQALDIGIEAQSLRRVILNKKRFEKKLYPHFFRDNPAADSPLPGYIDCRDKSSIPSKLLSTSKLVRVLDASEIDLWECPKEILVQLVNIRYLSLSCTEVPLEISRLWNLETLIICCDYGTTISIPYDICKLVKLKHVKISGSDRFAFGLVDFKNSTLETLQTLSWVKVKRSTANLIEKIPNIKKLGLSLWNADEDIDLSSLHNLENLKIRSFHKSLITEFPSSIAKLTLSFGYIDEKLMKIIGELSGLKVLKIQDGIWKDGGGGKEWKTYEGGFPLLEFLELEMPNLEQWNTEEGTHFPELRHLIIRGCDKLEDIPSCIREVVTLEFIELYECCESVVESGRRILEDQRDVGNNALQLRITQITDEEYKPILAGMLTLMEESEY